jgi:signal transduction histidine kinase
MARKEIMKLLDGVSKLNTKDVLDFTDLFKAVQIISASIELDQLIVSFLQIILESSGAKKAVLVLADKGIFQVRAVAFVEDSGEMNDSQNSATSTQTILDRQTLDTYPDIPSQIIDHVKQTRQSIVIDQGKINQENSGFSGLSSSISESINESIPENINENIPENIICDILNQQPQSILCTPIINQGKLLGILYLENQLISGIFTIDRCQAIQLLVTQGAIAIENAHLYQEAQGKAQLLEKSLQQQQTLFEVVTQIRDSLDLDIIFQAVTQNMRRILQVSRVGVYQFHVEENYQYGEFVAEDVLPEYPSGLAAKVQDHCFGENYANLYKNGRFCSIADVKAATIPACHRQILERFDVRAALIVPIMQDRELWGLLCVHQCDRPRVWLQQETEFTHQIAVQLGIALQQTELLIETYEQGTQLEETLEHLQATQLQLIQNEKMSALGNLVAGVAHEINNPVGCIVGNVGVTQDYIDDLLGVIDLYHQEFPQPSVKILEELERIDIDYVREDLPKLIRAMKDGGDRIKAISHSLRTFSRADSDQKQKFDLHEGIDSTILILRHRLKASDQHPEIIVETNYGQIPPIYCFPGQLNQVFMNIIANAIDALDESNQGRSFMEIQAHPNRITIETKLIGEQVQIKISDNGTGISDEVKEQIFDHLFTTKIVGKGTGLGLAIVQQIIIDKHEGSIEVDSTWGEGTTFTITLPIY